jgi:hypothetical protein
MGGGGGGGRILLGGRIEKLPLVLACSLGLSATSQQYLSLRTNQPLATSQQYSFLRTNQHQPSATSQPNRAVVPSRRGRVAKKQKKARCRQRVAR